MKYLFIILLLTGCSTLRYNAAKRSLKRIQNVAQEFPGLLDSLKLTTHDTTKTTEFKDRIVTKHVLDSAKFDSLAMIFCEELRSQPTVDQDEVRQKIIHTTRKKLSTADCPKLSKDTVYYIKIFNGIDTTNLPIKFSARVSGSNLALDISSSKVKLPHVRSTTDINFNCPQKSLLKNEWFWVSVGMFIIFLCLIIKRL